MKWSSDLTVIRSLMVAMKQGRDLWTTYVQAHRIRLGRSVFCCRHALVTVEMEVDLDGTLSIF